MASASLLGMRVLSLRRLCKRFRFCEGRTSAQSLNSPQRLRFISVANPSCQLSEPTESPIPENAETVAKQQLWRVVAAICVQRMPSLGKEKSPLEVQYEELKDQVRMERSKLSDHELEEAKFEKLKKARVRKAQDDQITDSTATTKSDTESNAFEDLQESRELELQAFKPAPRITQADRQGDMKSLNRKLDRMLYLLVKKPRKEHAWQMPQGGVEGEESLLETAKRELAEECGSMMKVKFYSSTPQAVLSYKHSPSPHDQPSQSHVGSKVFFLKGFYESGGLQLNRKEVVDYVWVTKEEMSNYVSEDYFKSVEPILLD